MFFHLILTAQDENSTLILPNLQMRKHTEVKRLVQGCSSEATEHNPCSLVLTAKLFANVLGSNLTQQ